MTDHSPRPTGPAPRHRGRRQPPRLAPDMVRRPPHLADPEPPPEPLPFEPSAPPVAPPSARLMRPEQVMELLGISRRTLGRHVASGRLRALRVGGVLRFRLEDLERFLDKAAPHAP